jgi:alkylation response protein AidB-like acyl-CoA dehydrogenase
MPASASINPTTRPSHLDAQRIDRYAAPAEASRFLHPVQQAVIHRRQWLKMLAPRELGGAELALPDVVRLEEELAGIDGSTAWVVTLCAGAGWFAGFLPPALARDILATPRLCVAGSGAPTGFADMEGDGFRLSGRWDYASGAPMATHFTLNAVLREGGQVMTNDAGAARIRAFIVPAAKVEFVPSWSSIGMRATASHSYRINGQWVSRDHGFEIDAACATAGGPLYRFPFLGLAFVTLTANIVGMASHFLRLAKPIIAQRRHARSGQTLTDCAPVQEHLLAIEAGIAAARTRFYALLDETWAQVAEGSAVSAQQSAALQTASLDLANIARRGVDELYPYCGLEAAREGSTINRVWRDLHTATQHSLFLP